MAFTVTDRFKTFVSSSSGREFEFKAEIGATTYDKAKVINFVPEFNIANTEEFTLGIICIGKLTIEVKTTDSIAYNAKIIPYVRLWGLESGVRVSSEWVPLGGFKIDSRQYANGVYTFICYDKLIETNQKFVSALTYPALMADVFNEIVTQLSFTVDASVVINPAYTIDYKDEDITIHDMLSCIASAHASSVRMTKDEKLIFVQYSPLATKTAIAASQTLPVTKPTNPVKTYTKVSIIYNTDGEVFTAGSGDVDHTLSFYNQFATQAIATAVYNAINGLSYTPCAIDWIGFIWLEVGDMVTVTMRDSSTFDSILMSVKESYKGGLKSSCKAVSKTQQQSEYQYEGKITKMLQNVVLKETNIYGVVIGQDHGIRVDKLDGSGSLLLNADVIQMTGAGEVVVFEVDVNGQLNLVGKLTSGNCTIDPILGFIYTITDQARVYFSGTEIKMQRWNADTSEWIDVLAFDSVDATFKFMGILEAAKILGSEGSNIVYFGNNGGSIDTDTDAGTGLQAMRLKPGFTSPNTQSGYIQILETGETFFYPNDGLGVDFASIREDGFYLGDVKICGFIEGTTQLFFSGPQLWVQADLPTEAKNTDIWADIDNYSRYDILVKTTDYTLLESDSEVIEASGTFTLTLHAATNAGIIKRIINNGTGIVTIAGTINGVTNMYLYPNESVELITDGVEWRY